MTIDERIEKLEFLLAGHIEQAKKDYEENRRLWREQQSHIEAVWMRIERGFAESRRLHDEGMAEMRREMAARDAVTDKRIADLVLAIGELCRRLDRRNG
jgi:hypothetical protein